MKKALSTVILTACMLSSCNSYQKIQTSTDYEYKYEAAKEFYTLGQYGKASEILNDIITFLKGTDKAEEAMYMQAMSYFRDKQYDNATLTFRQYYAYYPRGIYAELSRINAARAQYANVPEYQLDQTATYECISELQVFLDYFPESEYRVEAESMIFELQDQLCRKEYGSAKLYFDLGTYLGNNYQACVVTAQNALKDYPYTKYREDLALLIVKAKYEMARNSAPSAAPERYRDAVDECYAFMNEYDQSENEKDVKSMLKVCEDYVAALPEED